MKFITNKLGVVIVLIALVASLFIGAITNTTTESKTVTDYEFVTDMSQTFTYNTLPDYTEYNPIQNYTGYIRSDGFAPGVGYTPTTGASNYKIIGAITTSDATQDINGWFEGGAEVSGMPTSPNRHYWYVPDTDEVMLYNPKIVSLATLTDGIKTHAPSGTTSFTVTLQSGTDDPTYGFDTNLIYNWNYGIADWNIVRVASSQAYMLTASAAGRVNQEVIEYDIGTNATKVNGIAVDPNAYFVFWKDTDVYKLDGAGNIGGMHNYDRTSLTGTYTTNLYIEYTTTTYKFMKINDGVFINNADTDLFTNWTNGMENGIVEMIFGKNASVMSNTFTLKYTVAADDTPITLSRASASDPNILTMGEGAEAVDYDLGSWDYFVIRFDAIEGTLSVYPVSHFTNYTQFTVAETPLSLAGEDSVPIPVGRIKGMVWDAVTEDSSVYQSYKFTVSQTTVYATSKLLMVDPAININDYFTNADADGWRLNFYSFLTQGTSMTVNGQTYPVSDGMITIGNKSYKLTNVYVSYDKLTNHVTMTFVNDRITLDLGEWVTSVVSFTGTWFFNTGYYQAYITTQIDTNILWNKIPPLGTVALIFIAITMILMAIGIKKFGFGLPDYIVTIVSLAVAFCLVEVFI